MQVLNGAVFADHGLQNHRALNARLAGERRIGGLTWWISNPCETPCDTRTRCGVAALGTAAGTLLIAAQHTTHGATRNAARDAADDTGHTRRGGGGSSSLIICNFLGMAVGVRS